MLSYAQIPMATGQILAIHCISESIVSYNLLLRWVEICNRSTIFHQCPHHVCRYAASIVAKFDARSSNVAGSKSMIRNDQNERCAHSELSNKLPLMRRTRKSDMFQSKTEMQTCVSKLCM